MSEWKTIDSAPKDGTDILVGYWEFGRFNQRVARWAKNFHRSGFYGDNGWMSPGYQGLAHDSVTPIPCVWMPLPEPPK